jgi:hypothetical protein
MWPTCVTGEYDTQGHHEKYYLTDVGWHWVERCVGTFCIAELELCTWVGWPLVQDLIMCKPL